MVAGYAVRWQYYEDAEAHMALHNGGEQFIGLDCTKVGQVPRGKHKNTWTDYAPSVAGTEENTHSNWMKDQLLQRRLGTCPA